MEEITQYKESPRITEEGFCESWRQRMADDHDFVKSEAEAFRKWRKGFEEARVVEGLFDRGCLETFGYGKTEADTGT